MIKDEMQQLTELFQGTYMPMEHDFYIHCTNTVNHAYVTQTDVFQGSGNQLIKLNTLSTDEESKRFFLSSFLLGIFHHLNSA